MDLIQSAKVYDNEMVKAGDLQTGFKEGMNNIARLAKALVGEKSFFVGGKVTKTAGGKITVGSVLGFYDGAFFYNGEAVTLNNVVANNGGFTITLSNNEEVTTGTLYLYIKAQSSEGSAFIDAGEVETRTFYTFSTGAKKDNSVAVKQAFTSEVYCKTSREDVNGNAWEGLLLATLTLNDDGALNAVYEADKTRTLSAVDKLFSVIHNEDGRLNGRVVALNNLDGVTASALPLGVAQEGGVINTGAEQSAGSLFNDYTRLINALCKCYLADGREENAYNFGTTTIKSAGIDETLPVKIKTTTSEAIFTVGEEDNSREFKFTSGGDIILSDNSNIAPQRNENKAVRLKEVGQAVDTHAAEPFFAAHPLKSSNGEALISDKGSFDGYIETLVKGLLPKQTGYTVYDIQQGAGETNEEFNNRIATEARFCMEVEATVITQKQKQGDVWMTTSVFSFDEKTKQGQVYLYDEWGTHRMHLTHEGLAVETLDNGKWTVHSCAKFDRAGNVIIGNKAGDIDKTPCLTLPDNAFVYHFDHDKTCVNVVDGVEQSVTPSISVTPNLDGAEAGVSDRDSVVSKLVAEGTITFLNEDNSIETARNLCFWNKGDAVKIDDCYYGYDDKEERNIAGSFNKTAQTTSADDNTTKMFVRWGLSEERAERLAKTV